MNASKEVPSWFKLENYDAAKEFTAREWVFELSERKQAIEARDYQNHPYRNPKESATSSRIAVQPWVIEHSLRTFKSIKTYGLLWRAPKQERDSREERFFNRYGEIAKKYGSHKQESASVSSMSISDAWNWLANSDRFSEIDRELKSRITTLDSRRNDKKQWKAVENFLRIESKYSYPLVTIKGADGWPRAEYGFAKIAMTLSDQQIKRDFSTWLSKQRSNYKNSQKKLFTSRFFLGLHKARILPFLDLTTIAEIEDKEMPWHAIAGALFPNDIDVDVAERVRKVTQRKAAEVFTHKMIDALRLQAVSEKTGAE